MADEVEEEGEVPAIPTPAPVVDSKPNQRSLGMPVTPETLAVSGGGVEAGGIRPPATGISTDAWPSFVDPESGSIYKVDPKDASTAHEAGWAPMTPQQIASYHAEVADGADPARAALAFTGGALGTFTGGLSDYVARKMGYDPATLYSNHFGAHLAGQAAGIVPSILAGSGEADAGEAALAGAPGLISKVGHLISGGEDAATAAKGMGYVGKALQAGRNVAGNVAEGTLYGASQPLDEMALGDPNVNAESFLRSAWTGGLLGGIGSAGAQATKLGLSTLSDIGGGLVSKAADFLRGVPGASTAGEGALTAVGTTPGEVEQAGLSPTATASIARSLVQPGLTGEDIVANANSQIAANQASALRQVGLASQAGKEIPLYQISKTLTPLLYGSDEGLQGAAGEINRILAETSGGNTISPIQLLGIRSQLPTFLNGEALSSVRNGFDQAIVKSLNEAKEGLGDRFQPLMDHTDQLQHISDSAKAIADGSVPIQTAPTGAHPALPPTLQGGGVKSILDFVNTISKGRNTLGDLSDNLLPQLQSRVIADLKNKIKNGQISAGPLGLLAGQISNHPDAEKTADALLLPSGATPDDVNDRVGAISTMKQFAELNYGEHSPMAKVAPIHAGKIYDQAIRAATQLQLALPPTDSKSGLLSPRASVSPTAIQHWNSTVSGVVDPASLVRGISDGRMPSDELQAFQTSNPNTYSQARSSILQEITPESVAKLDASQSEALSKFVGIAPNQQLLALVQSSLNSTGAGPQSTGPSSKRGRSLKGKSPSREALPNQQLSEA